MTQTQAYKRPIRFSLVLNGKLLLAAGVLLFMSHISLAQLKKVPLSRNGIAQQKVKAASTAKLQATTLTLPFFDDFSSTDVSDPTNPYSGFPRQTLWEESYSVWINEGVGINAPSFNMATFDGLDSAGVPYSNVPLVNGFRDTLTSLPIDMSEAYVGPSERNTVYLSFFYQWRGNGESPDARDYIQVQFKDKDNNWIPALTIETKSSFDRNQFYDTIVQVNGDNFFHNNFQFRFLNYGRLSGGFDTWHIDYVYLNKDRSITDLVFPDAAFGSRMGPIFGPYYSVPMKHFAAAPSTSKGKIDVFNLRHSTPYSYYVTGQFLKYIAGVPSTITLNDLVPDRPVREGNVNLENQERVTMEAENNLNTKLASWFDPNADSTIINLELVLTSGDAGFFQSNDTVSMTYNLKDYYAYDDGTAEYAAVLDEPDDRVAYRFDMITDQPDQLIGFDVYVPAYAVSGSLTGEFFVMEAIDGAPAPGVNGEENYLAFTARVIKKEARNGFQRVYFNEPVIVKGQFFIGWRGTSGTQLRVGIDYNNNTSEKIYEDADGTWLTTGNIEGSLMIRPVFGNGDDITAIPEELSPFSLYPNPSDGSFFIEGKFDNLEVYNITGQNIPYDKSFDGDRSMISLPRTRPGLYVVQITRGTEIFTHKIIVR